ncbi:MAG: hypothetical protein II805_04780 [Candidatus Methanomethylophilus sp.]|nr:hypothetical protein [Methanomethylophilus sp.]
MYLVFCGVRDAEALLAHLLRLTSSDISVASDVVGVRVFSAEETERILADRFISGMEDVPGGYWYAETVDDGRFEDLSESALRARGRGSAGRRLRH